MPQLSDDMEEGFSCRRTLMWLESRLTAQSLCWARAEPCLLFRTKSARKTLTSSPRKKEVMTSETPPGSRPVSPEEQINMMLQKEMEIESKEAKPSKSDLEVHSCYCLSPNWHLSDSDLEGTAESPRACFKNTQSRTQDSLLCVCVCVSECILCSSKP